MKSTPFNSEKDYAPIPFDKNICDLARRMKDAGLQWHPHVGCFVWDPDHHIEVPSPFPERIYFILNLNHFIRIFGSTESIIEKLVWLPTFHQARLKLQNLDPENKILKQVFDQANPEKTGEELNLTYISILQILKKST